MKTETCVESEHTFFPLVLLVPLTVAPSVLTLPGFLT